MRAPSLASPPPSGLTVPAARMLLELSPGAGATPRELLARPEEVASAAAALMPHGTPLFASEQLVAELMRELRAELGDRPPA